VGVNRRGALRNRILASLTVGRSGVRVLASAGDSLAHTDPTFGRGLALAVMHAVALADKLESLPAGGEDLVAAYAESVMPETRAVYEDVAGASAHRTARWHGQVAYGPREQLALAVGRAATHDPPLWRAFMRYQQMLAPAASVYGSPDLVARAGRLAPARPARIGPDRPAMLAALKQGR